MTATSTPQPSQAVQYTFPRFIGYFLCLGATGFGGPIALAGCKQHLVEQRLWITRADFL